jgi:hypothetical protein
MVNQASLVTGRSMRVDNLQIYANISTMGLRKEGIMQYQFDWIGFAGQIGDGDINVGDALSGEMDLSWNDGLTIVYPSGYSAFSVYPSPDNIQTSERTLTWLGPRNFGAGEPHLFLEQKNTAWTDAIISNLPIVGVAVAAVSSGSLCYFLGARVAKANKILKSGGSQTQSPLSALGAESDEEKVIRLLSAAGGRIHQSTIVKKCGFSKSKASELVSSMEARGIVSRKKAGRGKIVTLIQKQETKRNS